MSDEHDHEATTPSATYCVDCGARLEQRVAFGRLRGVCPNCGHVHFEDPKVAVGVIVELEGKIVLGRRAHEPKLGLWSFPSGYVDAGEVVEAAAVREVEEEVGLNVRLDRLIGVYSRAGERIIFIAFSGSVIGGELVAGEECLEVDTFDPSALPELAFPHDTDILEAWAEMRGTPIGPAS
jgi:ADP-ribose pyrophosphatase YjhB (NUDIX family)